MNRHIIFLMDCIAPVERLRVLYCATPELPALWDGKREECGPPGWQTEGCQAAARTGQAAAWAVAACLRMQSKRLCLGGPRYISLTQTLEMISANLHGLTVSIASLQHGTPVLPAGCRCVGNREPAGEGKVSRSKEQPLGNCWLWRAGSRGEGLHSFTVY